MTSRTKTMAAIRIRAVFERPDSALFAGAGTAVVLVDDDVVVTAAEVVVRETVVEVDVVAGDEVVDEDVVVCPATGPAEKQSSAPITPLATIDPAPHRGRIGPSRMPRGALRVTDAPSPALPRVPFGGCWFEVVREERSGDARVTQYEFSSRSRR